MVTSPLKLNCGAPAEAALNCKMPLPVTVKLLNVWAVADPLMIMEGDCVEVEADMSTITVPLLLVNVPLLVQLPLIVRLPAGAIRVAQFEVAQIVVVPVMVVATLLAAKSMVPFVIAKLPATDNVPAATVKVFEALFKVKLLYVVAAKVVPVVEAELNATVPVEGVNVPFTTNAEPLPKIVKVFEPLADKNWDASIVTDVALIEVVIFKVELPVFAETCIRPKSDPELSVIV